MIEQTDLVVTKWYYQEPINSIEGAGEKLTSYLTFDVMKKTAPTKKGIACRFSCEFIIEKHTVLEYVGEGYINLRELPVSHPSGVTHREFSSLTSQG